MQAKPSWPPRWGLVENRLRGAWLNFSQVESVHQASDNFTIGCSPDVQRIINANNEQTFLQNRKRDHTSRFTVGYTWYQNPKRTWQNLKVLIAQPCPTLCNRMDCSPSGFSVHGIFQARILEWVAISFLRGSSWPRDWTCISCIGRSSLYYLSPQGSPKSEKNFKKKKKEKEEHYCTPVSLTSTDVRKRKADSDTSWELAAPTSQALVLSCWTETIPRTPRSGKLAL